MSSIGITTPSYTFMTKTLPLLYPKQYTGIGTSLFENFVSSITSSNTQIQLTPFIQAYSFICLVMEIANILTNLGLTEDITNKTTKLQKVIITRELFKDEFPPEKYAYAPVRYEKKEIIYYSSLNTDINSNEIEANHVIIKLYNEDNIPDEIKDTHISIYDYDISPPVAILKNESKSLTRTVLVAPNMDTNWNSLSNFAKYIYYPLHTFQPSMLNHALAYHFIKSYDYYTSIVLNTLASSNPFIYSVLNNIKLQQTDKQLLKLTFSELFKLVETTSDFLNSIVSAIANVTGNKSRVDPRNAILLLASILKDQDIIDEFNNSAKLYENVQKKLPSGKVKNIIVQSSHISYTPCGEYTIVNEKTTQLTAQGQRCSSSTTRKISRSSVIQVIPLLRSKIVIKDGKPTLIKIDNGVASSIESQLNISTTKELVISLPTTSWNDAIRFSGAIGKDFITEAIDLKVCTTLSQAIETILASSTTASFSWDSTTNIAHIKIINKGFNTTSSW